MIMDGNEKSDEGVLPLKRPNKGRGLLAEAVEGRTSPKGNGGQAAAVRTPSRVAASNGLAAVRQAARRCKDVRFTALLHHITVDLFGTELLRAEAGGSTWDRRREVAGLRR